jgi:hypothetical protein
MTGEAQCNTFQEPNPEYELWLKKAEVIPKRNECPELVGPRQHN